MRALIVSLLASSFLLGAATACSEPRVCENEGNCCSDDDCDSGSLCDIDVACSPPSGPFGSSECSDVSGDLMCHVKCGASRVDMECEDGMGTCTEVSYAKGGDNYETFYACF